MSARKGRKKKEGAFKGFENQKNRNSEILVLPPDLLQQIGIDFQQLSKYQAAPKDDSKANGIQEIQHLEPTTPNEVFLSPKLSASSSQSSMSETASLMTKSLFMSPSFLQAPDDLTVSKIPTATDINTIIPEYDIGNLSNNGNNFDNVYNIVPDKVSEQNAQDEIEKDKISNDEIQINKINNNIPVDHIEIEYFTGTLPENSFNNSESFIPINADLQILDIDNIEAVICNSNKSESNENLNTLIQNNEVNIEFNNASNNMQDNIKYLDNSEYITSTKNYATLNDRDVEIVNVNNSIAKNGGISSVFQNNNDKKLGDSRQNNAPNSYMKPKTKHMDEIHDTNDSLSLEKENKNKDYESYLTSNDETIEVNFIICDQEDVIPEQVKNIDSCSNNRDTVIYSNYKVQNKNSVIAPTTKKTSHQLNTIMADSNKSLNKIHCLNTDHDFAPHKLNKHGVEEPGGYLSEEERYSNKNSFTESKNIKTYENCAKRKRKIKKSKHLGMEININADTSEIDLRKDRDEDISLINQHFCICQDFGSKFLINKIPSSYTHIHFLGDRPAVCKVETLFSNDEELHTPNKETDLLTDESDDSNIEICWQLIKFNKKYIKGCTEPIEIKNNQKVKPKNNVCGKQVSNFSPKENLTKKSQNEKDGPKNNNSKKNTLYGTKEKAKGENKANIDNTLLKLIDNKDSHDAENSSKKNISNRATISPQKINTIKEINESKAYSFKDKKQEISVKKNEKRGRKSVLNDTISPSGEILTQKPQDKKEVSKNTNPKKISPNSKVKKVEKGKNVSNTDNSYNNFEKSTDIKEVLKEENQLEKNNLIKASEPLEKTKNSKDISEVRVPNIKKRDSLQPKLGKEKIEKHPRLLNLSKNTDDIEPKINELEVTPNNTGNLDKGDMELVIDDDNIKLCSKVKKRKRRKRQQIVSDSSDSNDDVPLTKIKACENNQVKGVKQSIENINVEKTTEKSVVIIQCGVCDVDVKDWDEHIMKEHNYVAWKKGETPVNVDNPEEVKQHLYNLSKFYGGLKCHKCETVRKYVKSYQQHMIDCGSPKIITKEPEVVEVVKPQIVLNFKSETGVVKCGICCIDVVDAEWIEHNRDKHEYLAKFEGEEPLNLEDKAEIHQHLYDLCKLYGGLACHKCGLIRKYVKLYLLHVEHCNPDKEVEEVQNVAYTEDGSPDELLTCGACNSEVKSSVWIEHIQKQHNYLGWRVGKEELDVNNDDSVFDHLERLLTKVNTFECRACGLKRRRIDTFMKHLKICYSVQSSFTLDGSEMIDINKADRVTCAICSVTVKGSKWAGHAIKEHYNLAWVTGGKPIDLKNPYEVEKYLRVYKETKCKMVCKLCNESRVSALGFYAHIITCQKSEEEIEAQKETCDKCNQKYLSIYRQQHLRYHEQQLQKAQVKEVSKADVEEEHTPTTARRAASRALAVINQYKKDNATFNCLTCTLETDNEKIFKNHVCLGGDNSDYSDKQAESSSDNDDDEEEECNDDEDEAPVRNNDTMKSSLALPFTVKNTKEYIEKSVKEICSMNFSKYDLYMDWEVCHFELLPEDEYSKYMPKMKESCQLSVHKSKWSTQALFDVSLENGLYSIFLGGFPTCIAWASPCSYEKVTNDNQFLAIACHNDLPSEVYDQLTSGPNLIQIWNFCDFISFKPKLAMGIAHDYGIVWSMAWCPSGTRSLEVETGDSRLGLLAISCSNGYAYLLVIPNRNITDNEIICRIKPVAKLSLCSGMERPEYQATCVEWSKKPGHSIITVGYSNGTIAYYDLHSKSPILRKQEDDVAVFYPYHDELMFKGPVLSLSLYVGKSGYGDEVLGASSVTGTVIKSRAGPMPIARQADNLGTSGGKMYTHWPSFMITCDDPSGTQRQHELEIFGESRRLTASCCTDSCLHCGEMASIALPLIRIIHSPHPARSEIKKQLCAIINMKPLDKVAGKKRKVDELAVKVEPFTYDTAIKKYGLEIYYTKSDKGLKFDDPSPDTFSLSHVRAAAFCPSPKFHKQFAFVTQTGMLFVMPLAYE